MKAFRIHGGTCFDVDISFMIIAECNNRHNESRKEGVSLYPIFDPPLISKLFLLHHLAM